MAQRMAEALKTMCKDPREQTLHVRVIGSDPREGHALDLLVQAGLATVEATGSGGGMYRPTMAGYRVYEAQERGTERTVLIEQIRAQIDRCAPVADVAEKIIRVAQALVG